MAFNIQGARQEGYSDDEILQHLTQTRKFDVDGAVKEGWSKSEIIDYLATTPAKQQSVYRDTSPDKSIISGTTDRLANEASAKQSEKIYQKALTGKATPFWQILPETLAEETVKMGGKIAAEIPKAIPRVAKSVGTAFQQMNSSYDVSQEKPWNIPIIGKVDSIQKEGINNAEDFTSMGADPRLAAAGAFGLGVAQTIGDVKLSQEIPGAIKDFAAEKLRPHEINALEKQYDEWFSGSAGLSKKSQKAKILTEFKNTKGTTGQNPSRVLAESGIYPQTEKGSFYTVEQAQQYRDTLKPFQDTMGKVISELNNQPINPPTLDDLMAQTLKNARTPKNIASGDYSKIEREIIREFNDLKNAYGTNKINWNQLNDIKTQKYSQTFNYQNPQLGSTNYEIAKTANGIINNALKESGANDALQFNRFLSDKLEAAKFLESLNGKKMPGNMINKLTGRILGMASGTSVPGRVAGMIIGDSISEALTSSSVPNPVKRMILDSIKEKSPVEYANIINWLEKQGVERSTRLALPSPKEKIINQGRPIEVAPSGRNIDLRGGFGIEQSRGNKTIKEISNIVPKKVR